MKLYVPIFDLSIDFDFDRSVLVDGVAIASVQETGTSGSSSLSKDLPEISFNGNKKDVTALMGDFNLETNSIHL